MAKLINAHAIYSGLSGKVLYDYPVVTINCEQIAAFAPRPVAIKQRVAPGFGFAENVTPTFDLCDPEIDSNTLFGYAIQLLTGDGTGRFVVIDALSVDAIVGACNACCDDEAPVTLTGIYTSGVPGVGDLSLTTYTLTRMDDGTPFAVQQASLDYWYSYFPGTFRHTGWQVSGVSTYTFRSAQVPVAQGSDVIS